MAVLWLCCGCVVLCCVVLSCRLVRRVAMCCCLTFKYGDVSTVTESFAATWESTKAIRCFGEDSL